MQTSGPDAENLIEGSGRAGECAFLKLLEASSAGGLGATLGEVWLSPWPGTLTGASAPHSMPRALSEVTRRK